MSPPPFGRIHLGLILLALANMVPAVEVEQSWHLLAIAFLCAVASLFLMRPDGTSRMPEWGIHAMIGTAGAFLLFEMFAPHDEPTVHIIDLAHFMMFLGCCKFFDLKGYRDYGLVATISFLLLVISGFASGSPLFGLVLIIDLTFGLAWLLSFQSIRASDLILAQRAAVFAPEAAPLRKLALGPRRKVFIVPATLIAITLSLFAGLVFLAVPRGWGKGLFVRIQGVMPTSVTAFSGDITLEDGNIVEDVTPVMKLTLRLNGRVVNDQELTPYMRGMTFERYERGRWETREKKAETIQLDDAGHAPPLTRLGAPKPTHQILEQQVWLDNLSSGALFALYPPMEFTSTDIGKMRVKEADLCLQTDERPRKGVRYTVRTVRNLSANERVILDPPPENPTRPMRLSAIHPEVRRYAREFFSRYGDPSDPAQRRRLAQRLCDHLSGGEYQYSLSRGARLGGSDPVKDFLFRHKRGHCEYFASAMTVLCQAAGIPARIVNGYMGGEYDATGGFFQFRQRDAHAWVEVFLSEEGWVAFDPSPVVQTRLARQEEGWPATFSRMLDQLQFKWSTLIVAFDAESWYTLVENLGAWVEKIQKGDSANGRGISVLSILWGPDELPLWQRFFYWLLLVLMIAFIVLVLRALGIVSLMLKENVESGRRGRQARVRQAEARFYDRLLLLLANKGYVKLSHLSPMEFARDLARANRDFAELPLLTQWYYTAQYGRRTLSPAQSTRIKAFLGRLREDASFGNRTDAS